MATKPKRGKTIKKHIVVFQDLEGNVLKTAFVPDGENALPPEVPGRIGETAHHTIEFSGWSESYEAIHQNKVLRPVYKKKAKKYIVMYYNENGKLLGMEPVLYGNSAVKIPKPIKASDEEFQYPFLGWTADLKHITKDTNAKALFGKVRRSFRVRFYHEDGTLLKEERVTYGKSAHAPEQVTKQSDETYHYEFAGWTYPFEVVKNDVSTYASFRYIYNDYQVIFYNKEELADQMTYHYGDEIQFPKWKEKGYTLIWDHVCEYVTGDEVFKASWEFTNQKGKIINTKDGSYQITNPSISNGTVKCLKYKDSQSSCVKLPERVKLGDYYYRIDSIASKCFTECTSMAKLIISDTVTSIDEYGLASCRQLKEVILGKKVSRLGAHVFKDNQHLKKIQIKNTNYKAAYSHKLALDGIRASIVSYK